MTNTYKLCCPLFHTILAAINYLKQKAGHCKTGGISGHCSLSKNTPFFHFMYLK